VAKSWKQLARVLVVEQMARAVVVAVADIGVTIPLGQAVQVTPPTHAAQLEIKIEVLPGYAQPTHALLTGVVAYPRALLQAVQVAAVAVVGAVQAVHPRTPL